MSELEQPSSRQYAERVAALADRFKLVRLAAPDDRSTAVSILDALSQALTRHASELMAVEGPRVSQPQGADLYDGMPVYHLLDRGWGSDLYSCDQNVDALDERLFNSLLDIVRASDRVMPGSDFNKRAYEAFDQHFRNPSGQILIREWFERLNEVLRYYDSAIGATPRQDPE